MYKKILKLIHVFFVSLGLNLLKFKNIFYFPKYIKDLLIFIFKGVVTYVETTGSLFSTSAMSNLCRIFVECRISVTLNIASMSNECRMNVESLSNQCRKRVE